eukprot:CAMPEP_0202694800 /NCGR_PEP_ID=MMETSP1385-20130828/8559_1 /ASSEMBLY_ACC=CAM_ASM_000861 /TAXON_ID=933848 /ORGANISM="Elphidium margaritaceum" /LENGTH=211 /DNA_ID=CAMNT_0049350703 /DNA_START=487 /DNA_END=1122 /DNA_ORIENTATION=+
MYDLVMFDKYAALTSEAFVLCYFLLYVVLDGWYSHGGKYRKTVWLYVEYILVAWIGFIFFVFVIDRDRKQHDVTYLMSIYNATNCVAYMLLFAGLVWEQRISKEVEPTLIEDGLSDSSTGLTAVASSDEDAKDDVDEDDVDDSYDDAQLQDEAVAENDNSNQQNLVVTVNARKGSDSAMRHQVHPGQISPFTEQPPMLDFASADLNIIEYF